MLPTRTETASRSASKTASVTSPRSSPSASSGSGSSQTTRKPSTSWPCRTPGRSTIPRPETARAKIRNAIVALLRSGATKSRPSSKSRLGREAKRPRPGVREHRIVRDEEHRRPADVADLEPGRVAPRQPPHRDARVREVAAPLAVTGALHRLQLADGLGVDPDAGREREAPAVDPPERDPSFVDGLCRVARHAERAGEHVRVPAGDDPERLASRQSVQHLVDESVAAVDEHGVALRRGRQLGRVALALGEQRLDRVELFLERAHLLLGHPGRERIDDQRDLHAGVEYPRIPSTSCARKRSASASVSRPGCSQV